MYLLAAGFWVIKSLGKDQCLNLMCLRTRSFVERQAQTGGERGGGEELGLTTKLWQKQTGCTILMGRFNYKWCFHSEPSRNPLFFRRSSSPNPQQGLVWPASEARRLTRVMHYEWCKGDTRVLILQRALWTSIREQNANFSRRKEQGWGRSYRALLFRCHVMWKKCVYPFQIDFSPPLLRSFVLLSPNIAPLTFFPFISSERLSLSKNSTGGGWQSQQTALLCSLEWCMALSCITTNTLSLPLSSISSSSSSSLWNPLQSTLSSSSSFSFFPARKNRSWHRQRKDKNNQTLI